MREFSVRSGKVTISDPCYDTGELKVLARNGRWLASVRKSDEGSWGRRVSSILVHHESFDPIGKDYKEEVKYIGVDSGQAGVFDADSYGHGSFYDTCCRATSKDFGFVPGGFVTTSGYGDGGYQVKVHRSGGKSEAVEIVFIPEVMSVQGLSLQKGTSADG